MNWTEGLIIGALNEGRFTRTMMPAFQLLYPEKCLPPRGLKPSVGTTGWIYWYRPSGSRATFRIQALEITFLLPQRSFLTRLGCLCLPIDDTDYSLGHALIHARCHPARHRTWSLLTIGRLFHGVPRSSEGEYHLGHRFNMASHLSRPCGRTVEEEDTMRYYKFM